MDVTLKKCLKKGTKKNIRKKKLIFKMRSFIYKTLIFSLAIILIFEFTIGRIQPNK